MNKRIEELIEQCTTIEYGVDNGSDRMAFDKEKFAELIVAECDDIMEKYSRANMESDAWVNMVTMMQKELKHRFGVE